MWGFIPLPAAFAAELARLEAELGQVADEIARAELAALDDAAAARVLNTVAGTGDRVRNISGFVKWLARREREAMLMERNAAGILAESGAFSSGPFSADDLSDGSYSVQGPLDGSDVQMEVESPDRGISFGLPSQPRIEPRSPAAPQIPCRLQDGQRRSACAAADPDAQVSGDKGACGQRCKSREESFATFSLHQEEESFMDLRRNELYGFHDVRDVLILAVPFFILSILLLRLISMLSV